MVDYAKKRIKDHIGRFTKLYNQIISFVSVDLEEHRRKYANKSVKKTLSIPAWLNTLAEKENVNFSQVLQNALKDYLKIDDKKNLHDINI